MICLADRGGIEPAEIDRHDAPLRLPPVARLRPHPADVRGHAEDDGLGLELADDFVVGRPVVDLPLAVRPFAVGPVEPDLVDRAVVRQELAKLRAEMLVVFRGIAVARLVPVPGRKVDADAEPEFAAGLDHVAHDVALAAAPRAAFDAVRSEAARPEAEAVVVLRREDQHAHPGGLESLDPLARVEVRRVEELGVLRPLAPFPVGEGVHAEMGEGDEFPLLPGPLRPRRNDCGRLADDVRRAVAGQDLGEIPGLRRLGGRPGLGTRRGDGKQGQGGD